MFAFFCTYMSFCDEISSHKFIMTRRYKKVCPGRLFRVRGKYYKWVLGLKHEFLCEAYAIAGYVKDICSCSERLA